MTNLYSRLPLKISLFFSIILFLGVSQVNAQRKSSITGQKFKLKKKTSRTHRPYNFINNIQGGLGIGSATYYGDLCDGGDCLQPNLSLRLDFAYRITPHFSTRTSFSYFHLSGTDEGGNYEDRGLSFNSNNYDFQLDAVFDLFAFRKMYRSRRMFNPYAAIGIGVVYFDSYTEIDGEKYKLRPLQTEGVSYSPYSFIMPFSLGVKWSVAPHIELALEWTYVKAFSDYLDDVSDSYPENASLISDPTGTRSGKPWRGNPDKKDAYTLLEVKFLYTLKITKQTYNINSNVSRFRMINNVKKKR